MLLGKRIQSRQVGLRIGIFTAGIFAIGIFAVGMFLLGCHASTPEDALPDADQPAIAEPATRVDPAPPSAEIRWVVIPGGIFRMGSSTGLDDEQPARTVEVQGFEMSETEVTVAQYRLCVEAGACPGPNRGSTCNWGHPDRQDHPINCVSWLDAQEYALWSEARLPTEAEWEYAARGAGLDRRYPWGEDAVSCEGAVLFLPEENCTHPGALPVCSRPEGRSVQGLCDMSGNVWEWVEDDWHPSYLNAPDDGSAWIDDPRASLRVARGGSWKDSAKAVTTTYRSRHDLNARYDLLGFRIARDLD